MAEVAPSLPWFCLYLIRHDVAVAEAWLAARQGLPLERVENPRSWPAKNSAKKLFGTRVLPATPAG